MVPLLTQYVNAARPAVSRMLGLTPPSPQPTPQQLIDDSFSLMPPAPKGDFLGQPPPPSTPPPTQLASQAPPGPPLSLMPPGGGGGGSPTPPPAGLYDDSFIGRLSQMGSRPGAGLIPQFAYLAGLGRSNNQ